MLRWSLVSFAIAIFAAVLGFGGLAPQLEIFGRLFFFSFAIGGTILLAGSMLRALDRRLPSDVV